MGYSIEKTKIRKIGNGRGILLSKSLCNLLGMSVEDSFRIELEDERLVLVPLRKEVSHHDR